MVVIRRLVGMMPLLLALSATGCSILSLRDELRIGADSSIAVLKTTKTSGNDPIVAEIYQQHGQSIALLERRVSSPSLPVTIIMRNGPEHRVFMFQDSNRDQRWQPDEPASDVVPVQTPISIRKDKLQKQSVDDYPATVVTLDRDPAQLNARKRLVAALDAQQMKRPRPFLDVTSFENYRFGTEVSSLGTWQPLTFVRDHGYGLFLLAPWEPAYKPVLFVHGINDSPRVWATTVAAIGGHDIQPLLFHYPSSLSLEYSANELAQFISQLCLKQHEIELPIVAHSMGGLVARRAIQLLDQEKCSVRIPWLLTIATPFAGSNGAQLGVEMSPIVAPVWLDMAPGSAFLQQLQEPMKRQFAHHLVVSFGNASPLLGASNDGVVTVDSQLPDAIYDAAASVTFDNSSHVATVSSKRTTALLNRLLALTPTQP